MILRAPLGELHGQPPENGFVAYDDMNITVPIAAASVRPFITDQLMPERPLNLYIRLEGASAAYDMLMGAALARCRQFQWQFPDMPSRIYSECHPEDDAMLDYFAKWKMLDDDGVIRVGRALVEGPLQVRMPSGCMLITDTLSDQRERQFFLDRYNRLFSRRYGMGWLEGICARPNFLRLMLVAPEGVAGEMLTYSSGEFGVVGTIYTVPRWQKRHVASHLLECARQHWIDRGLRYCYADVWRRLRPAMELFKSAGFRRDAILVIYPGIDIPPVGGMRG